MKKRISLLLILALLLSLCGCAAQPISPITTPTESILTEAPEITEATIPAEEITVPDLVGQQYHKLTESDDYLIAVSQTVTNTTQAEGTILGQAPSGGSIAEKGVTVYVIVTTGGPEDAIPAEPEETEPVVSRPVYTEPDLPEQTDPPDMLFPQITEPEETEPQATEPQPTEPQYALDRNGSYTTKEDVALYLHLYGCLPGNFVTKSQAKSLYNWKSGSLAKYGKCIGGDRFYNNEGLLPDGYVYYECDIDTLYNTSSRGSRRLVFTYSGIIYYTSDHYKSFTRLY